MRALPPCAPPGPGWPGHADRPPAVGGRCTGRLSTVTQPGDPAATADRMTPTARPSARWPTDAPATMPAVATITPRRRRPADPAPRRLPRPHRGRPPTGPPRRARPGDRRGRGGGAPAAGLAVSRCGRCSGVPRRLDELGRGPGRRRRAGLRHRPARRWPRSSASTSTAACSRWPTGPVRPDLIELLARRPAAWRCWRGSTTTRTSAPCSATRPRSASTGCCSARAAPTRCTGAASGCRWATCCGCRSPSCRARGRPSLDALRTAGLRVVALTPAPDAGPLTPSGLAGGRVALLLGAEGPGLSDGGAGRGRRPGPDPDGAGRRLAQRGDGRRRGVLTSVGP